MSYLEPFTSNLNHEQRIAVSEIADWLTLPSSADNYYGHILSGWAGTGKSFTTKALVNYLSSTGASVVITAPTNKAVKVCRDMVPDATTGTIHSFLGIKPRLREDRMFFERDRKHKKMGHADYVILDECGMVGLNMFEYIRECMHENNTRFIFVGDPEQLNPVKEPISPIWKTYKTSHLNTVVRHGDYILDVATSVRNADDLQNTFLKANHSEDEGVWTFSRHREFVDRIEEYVRQGKFTFDRDNRDEETKIIAWRNVTVDAYNTLVRNILYGGSRDAKGIPHFVIGDKLIMTAPHSRSPLHELGSTSYTTDEEVDVIGITPTRDGNYGFKTFLLRVERLDSFGNVVEDSIQVVDPADYSNYKHALEEIANRAREYAKLSKSAKLNKYERANNDRHAKDTWREFWELKEQYAEVKYAFAITAHRAQGSTYTNVFVDTGDILVNPNMEEAKRCLYVAVTRASRRLYINAY